MQLRLESVQVSSPSLPFRLMRRLVQAGLLRRGYGWLLLHLPPGLWGGESIEVGTDVGEMTLPIGDPASSGLLLFGRVPHEIRETALTEKLARDCRIALDVGSHVGWYARLLWRAIGGKGKVYAFEPNPRTFRYLQENTKDRAGLFAFWSVIGDAEAPTKFYCAQSSGLSSAVRAVGPSVVVESRTLDGFCQSECIAERVDFIKCDVEGGEVAVLRGARSVRLFSDPIWLIEVDELFLEQAGTSAEELMEEIVRRGRGTPHLFYLDRSGTPVEIGHVSERTGTTNVFIVPEARLSRFMHAAGYSA